MITDMDKPLPQFITCSAAVMPETMTAVAEVTETKARTITGRIVAFGTKSNDNRLRIEAGALKPRTPLKRVKLLVDHDQSQPVGFMAALDHDRATFTVPEGEAGDRALADANTGRRDGLSIGATINAARWSDDGEILIVSDAELYEVSLCAIPAFADAGVESVAATMTATYTDTPRKETVMRLTAAQLAALEARLGHKPTAAEVNAEADRLEASAKSGPTVTAATDAREFSFSGTATATAETPTGPAPTGTESASVRASTAAPGFGQAAAPGVTATKERPKSFNDVVDTVSAAINTGNTGQIMAALSDVVPADDAGTGFIGRENWLGELWTATKTGRPHIDAFGTPKQLTSMKLKGWQWDVRPKPAKYEGNKAEVPTNKPKTKPVEASAERWAGGWDIDRIFLDLGDPGFLAAFWNAAMQEYQLDSDADVATKILADATDGGESAGVIAGIASTAADLRAVGATLSHLFLSDDLFDVYADLRQDEVPFWLAQATGSVSLKDATANVADLRIEADPLLPSGALLGFDSRAATVYEKSPIQLQALDIAKGGIDLGFFSYGGVIVNDPRAIVKRTVTEPAEVPPEG